MNQQQQHEDDDEPPEMSDAMRDACGEGDTLTITTLLDAGEDINLADEHSMPPILRSLYAGHLQATKLLFARGADPSKVDISGWNALHCSSIGGNVNCINFVFDNTTIDVNSIDNDDWNAIAYALNNANLDAAKLLIEKGANIFMKNDEGERAIVQGDEHLGPQVLQHAKDLIWDSVKPLILLSNSFSSSIVTPSNPNTSIPSPVIKIFSNPDLVRHISIFLKRKGIITVDPLDQEPDEVRRRIESSLAISSASSASSSPSNND
jgi:hypothetical protein